MMSSRVGLGIGLVRGIGRQSQRRECFRLSNPQYVLGAVQRTVLNRLAPSHRVTPFNIGISHRRGVATQANDGSGLLANSSSLDALSAHGDLSTSYLAPLVPYIDLLPSYFGMAQSAPYAYAISIVLATLILRTTITLPIALWQRARNRRLREDFLPQWKEVEKRLPSEVARACRAQRKSHAEYVQALKSEAKKRQRALLRANRCSPRLTIAGQLAVNIPLFIAASLTLRTALLASGTTIGAETIPWWSPPAGLMAKFEEGAKLLQARGLEGEALQKLTTIQGPTLSEVDKTMYAPIGLGLFTLINVEINHSARREYLEQEQSSSTEKEAKVRKNMTERERLAAERVEKQKWQSTFRSTVLTNVYRAAAIAFVFVASQAPAGVVIYWISSALYTLVQGVVFSRMDSVRHRSKG